MFPRRTISQRFGPRVGSFGSMFFIMIYGVVLAAAVFSLLQGWIAWWIDLLCILGMAAMIVEESRILLIDRARSNPGRGFEVKLMPGTTPGVIEEKEE